ncbi:MAG: hypothetical protein H7067_14845 [Burkholderiales bacterium]|nr:hypothetical protein [Opitutaceae bacterium]
MNEEEADSEADARRERDRRDRRRLWRWLGVVGVVFAGVLGLVIYSDAPPPDLADLAFEPVVVADADNLYLVLVKRGEAMKAAPIIEEEASDVAEVARLSAEELANATGTGAREELPSLRERLMEGDDWTPERLAHWGPVLDALAEELAQMLKLPAAQGMVSVASSGEYPKVGEIRELFQQVRLAGWARYRDGRQIEAANTALGGLEAGVRMADARGAWMDYFVALAIQGMFVADLQDMAADADVRPETLLRIAAGLRLWPPGTDGYAHSLRNEARHMGGLYEDLEAEEVAGWRGHHWNPSAGPVALIARTRVLFPLVYKRNLTVGLHADAFRTELRVYDLPITERPKRSADEFGGEIQAKDLLRPANVLGRFLVETSANTFESTAVMRHMAFSRRGLLEAFVALRLYHLAHGALPESLDELVPEYLPAVPVDYVDRQPIRYSREYRTLWSVGRTNLLVTMANQKIPEREVFAVLDFAAPAAEKKETAR